MNRHSLTMFVTVVILGMVFMGPPGRAATFERMDFDQITGGAEQIFFGTVSSASSMFAGSREIVTDFRFTDVELIKGELLELSPKVRMLGGTVGNTSLAIAGAPTFLTGKRYLVFIAGNGKVMFPALGGPQGIFEVRSDEISGEATMYDYGGRALTSLPISTTERASTQKGSASQPGIAESSGRITKDAFVKAIQKRLGQ